MLCIKGFAIVPRRISVIGDSYYGTHTTVPFSQVYNSREEAETALKENKVCYISPEMLEVREVEAVIK